MPDENKIIYTMIDVTKEHDRKVVLKGINLSYFYGAKIGVLGLNGAGKSSLLRILAGVDTEFEGKTVLQPGYTVGFLEQEPKLDPEQTVKEAVMEAAQETYDLLAKSSTRSTRSSPRRCPPEAMDKLLDRQAKVQDKLEHDGRVGDRQQARAGDGCAALPAGGREDRAAVRRGEAPGCAVPAAAAEPGHPAAGRADQPPGRGLGRLARAAPGPVPGHGDRGDARPLFPGQRRRLDPRTGPRGAASRGRATTRPGWSRKTKRLASEAKQDAQTAQAPAARAGVDPQEPGGPTGEEQGAHPAVRGPVRAAAAKRAERDRYLHPAGPAAGQRRHQGQGR